MNAESLTPLQRIGLALYALVAVLFRPDVALAVHEARRRRRALAESPGRPIPAGRTTVEQQAPAGATQHPAEAPPPPAKK